MKWKKINIISVFLKIATIFIVMTLGMSNVIIAQSEKEIINIFKTKIDSLQNCISKEEWLLKDIKYDVKKTESLIIPIQGELEFTAIVKPLILIDNPYASNHVLLKLYWSSDDKKWVVEKLLAKHYGDASWTEPEKDSGWRLSDGRPGFKLEDLLIALRKHFSSK